MPTATILIQMRCTDLRKLEPALDRTNAHRKQFSATGHTLARNVNDPEQPTATVRFADSGQDRAWVQELMSPGSVAAIFGDAGLSEIEIWLGDDLEDIEYT